MKPQLSSAHRKAYDAIFRDPVSSNVAWPDVRSLLGALAKVEEPDGNLKITRHGQTLVLHTSPDKEVAQTDELMAIRRFLERSDRPPEEAPAEGDDRPEPADLLPGKPKQTGAK